MGVPSNHPFADIPTGMETHPDRLYNVRFGPVRLPAPPTFVVCVRRPGVLTDTGPNYSLGNFMDEQTAVRREANIAPDARVVHIETTEGSQTDLHLIDS